VMIFRDVTKLGLKLGNFARKCLPPFTIIPLVATQIMQACMKGAMKPNFKARKIPYMLLGNTRKFTAFPSAAMNFAKNAKELLKLLGTMSVKDAPGKALTDKSGGGGGDDDDDDDNAKFDVSDMGETFAKGKNRADKAKSAVSQGEKETAKMPSNAEDDGDNDGESEAGDEENDDNLTEEMLETKFAEVDIDGDGTISSAELKQAIEQNRPGVKAKEIDEIMKEADANGDGNIDLSEFMQAMRHGTKWAEVEVDA